MLFGNILDGEMVLNRNGQIVRDAWSDLTNHYRHVELGAFVIMPNHVHGIIVLVDEGRGGSDWLARYPCPLLQIGFCTADQPSTPYGRNPRLAA